MFEKPAIRINPKFRHAGEYCQKEEISKLNLTDIARNCLINNHLSDKPENKRGRCHQMTIASFSLENLIRVNSVLYL